MKNTITKFIATTFAVLALFTVKTVNAQTTAANKWRLGVGLELGAPTGNAHDISNFELGGTARLQYGISNNFALTFTSGYYNMFGKSPSFTILQPNGGSVTTNIKIRDLGIIPVKIGIKSFFINRLYFGAEAGAGFETSVFGLAKGSSSEGFEKNTKLILSPTIGYATKKIDLGLRYENFSGQGNNYGLIGLRIAYGFGL